MQWRKSPEEHPKVEKFSSKSGLTKLGAGNARSRFEGGMKLAETAKTASLQEETRIFNTPQDIIEYSNAYQWMKKGFKTDGDAQVVF